MAVRVRTYAPAGILLAASVAFTGGLTLWPQSGQPVAAIYPFQAPPHVAFGGVIEAGAEAVLGIGAVGSIVVARSDDPRFIDRLYQSGALMVVRAPTRGECLR